MQMTYIYLRSSDVGEIPMRCTSCAQTWTSAIRLDEKGGIVLTPLRAGIEQPTTIH